MQRIQKFVKMEIRQIFGIKNKPVLAITTDNGRE